MRGYAETPDERAARITKRANEARPKVSMTPGQAETLTWGSKFGDPCNMPQPDGSRCGGTFAQPSGHTSRD